MHPKTSSGFTLFEISIVLIVIALIAGGITVGNRVLQNAKLLSLGSSAEEMRGYMLSFKDKYDYFPGDFPHATSIWPAMSGSEACDDSGDASNDQTSSTPVAATCDGRGNGVIGNEFKDSTQFSNASSTDLRELRERFYVWQHLSLAGFIEGQYSGYSTSNNFKSASEVNVPATEFSDLLGFTIEYSTNNLLALNIDQRFPVSGAINHVFSWSNPEANEEALIDSTNALRLDKKFDDGQALSGKIFAGGESGNPVDGCATSGQYRVDIDRPCAQYMRNFLE